MTQLEKSINKADLEGFKTGENRINAMVPGIFNESPYKVDPLRSKDMGL